MKRALGTLLITALLSTTPYGAFARQQENAALQAIDDQLPGDLINDPSNMAWTFSGKTMTTKPVRDPAIPGGGAGISIKVSEQGADPWAAQAQIPLLTDIAAGQTVTIGFYARTIKAETTDHKGLITIRAQQNVSPFSGFIDQTVAVGPEWAFLEVTGKATRAIPKGQAVIALQLAGAQQELQLGQTIVVANAAAIAGTAKPAAQGPQVAQLPESLKGKGDLLLDASKRDGWAFYGPGITHKAGTSRVMGVSSINVATAATTPNAYDNAISITIDSPIKSGDSLILAISGRANSSDAPGGTGKLGARIMVNEQPWPGFGDIEMTMAAGKWQMLSARITATQDIPAGKGAIQIQLGKAKQDLDFGPVFLIKEAAPPAQ